MNTTSDRRGRGRPATYDRLTAIEQALTLFWQHGYQATSIASLTQAMNIKPPTLYAAFGDKQSLFRECVAFYRDKHEGDVIQAFLEGTTARDAIERMLQSLAAKYTDASHPPGCLIISAAVVHGTESDAIAADLKALRHAFLQAIVDRIDADIMAGVLPVDIDAQALAAFYVAVVQGMSRQAQDGASRQTLEAIATSAMRAWPPD